MSLFERTVERAITALCSVVLWVSMVVMFVILVANTALRYATGDSLQWASELPELLFPWMVMAGVVLAAVRGSHITTQFLVDALPATLRHWIAVASSLLVAALYATLVWATWGMLEIVHDERTQILGIPGSVTYACLMVGMSLLALLALQSAWRALSGANQDAGRDAATSATNAPAADAPHW